MAIVPRQFRSRSIAAQGAGVRAALDAFGPSGFGAAADAASDASGALLKIERQKEIARRKSTLNEQIGEAARALDRLQLEAERNPDPAAAQRDFDAGVSQLRGRLGKPVFDIGDEALSASFDTTLKNLTSTASSGVRRKLFAKEIDRRTARLDLDTDDALRRAAALSGPARAAAVKAATDGIARAAQAGTVTWENAVSREQKFLAGLDRADALSAIRADPEAAVAALEDPGNFARLDPVVRTRLTTQAQNAVEAADRAAETAARRADTAAAKALEALQDATEKEGWRLWREGQLTKDWIDDNADNLKAAAHDQLTHAYAGDGPVRDDPDTFQDISLTVDADPAGARRKAAAAHKAGLLKNETFRAFVRDANAAERRDGPASQYVRSKDQIKNALRPIEGLSDIGQPVRFAAAMRDYEDYAAEKARSDEELRAFADETIRRYQLIRTEDLEIALPLPYGFAGARTAVTAKDIAAAKKRLGDDYRAGRIPADRAAREALLLKSWRRVRAEDEKKKAETDKRKNGEK